MELSGLLRELVTLLKDAPLPLMTGVAIGAVLVLLLPWAGADLGPFAHEWRPYVISGAALFGSCAVVGWAAKAITWMRTHPEYHFRALPGRCFWMMFDQPDGTFVSSLMASLEVSNMGERTLRIVAARLVRPVVPQDQALHSNIFIWTPELSREECPNAVAPHDQGVLTVKFSVRGTIGAKGRQLPITLALTTDPPGSKRISFSLAWLGPGPSAPPKPAQDQFTVSVGRHDDTANLTVSPP